MNPPALTRSKEAPQHAGFSTVKPSPSPKATDHRLKERNSSSQRSLGSLKPEIEAIAWKFPTNYPASVPVPAKLIIVAVRITSGHYHGFQGED
ncbi:hypothetical protein E6H36_00240 [Candidatus Bathyarchaeota archaeon]|nr:MAG: hypothetical protein E6H36_00240 [Candidatus Bathyarchaeota archaeon]